MAEYVVDTHALFWNLSGDRRLGSAARRVFDSAAANGDLLLIPTIVLAELFYVNEKLGRPLDFVKTVSSFQSCSEYLLVDLTPADVLRFETLITIPEMHDRIIASVAIARGIPVLTKDQWIVQNAMVQTIW